MYTLFSNQFAPLLVVVHFASFSTGNVLVAISECRSKYLIEVRQNAPICSVNLPQSTQTFFGGGVSKGTWVREGGRGWMVTVRTGTEQLLQLLTVLLP